MFQTIQKQDKSLHSEKQHIEEKSEALADGPEEKEQRDEAGGQDSFSEEYNQDSSIDGHAGQENLPTEKGAVKENSKRQDRLTVEDSTEEQEQPAEEGHVRRKEVQETRTEEHNRKLPSFFEKLLPGFYHPKKKDYIQLKQREREQQDHLAEMRRMADDLYAQNYMDEETCFIFCELAFNEQALDKETADVLMTALNAAFRLHCCSRWCEM